VGIGGRSGGLSLDGLGLRRPGAWRVLSAAELEALFDGGG
jgi:hypothetical protein